MAKFPLSRNAVSRPGLTLMELIVVLVILIGLAGIVIPMLPSMLGRTETATWATSQTEIIKWVQTYEQLHQGYPRDWDALVDSGGKFLQDKYVRGGADVIEDTLSAEESAALEDSGIDRLQIMSATPENKTFNPYGSPDYATNGQKPSAIPKLVILSLSGQQRLNLASGGITSGGKFVVLGFGKRASIVGKGVANAPVVFRDDGRKTPDLVYCRYGVVFQVTASDGTPFERARFVGVCNFKGDHISTSDDDLQEFYDLNRGGA